MRDEDRWKTHLYVVMINYGSEGWKIHKSGNIWQHAVEWRDEAMGFGNREVWIMKPVRLDVREAPND